MPFSTAWVADSRLAAAPVSLYAAIFFLVDATYLALYWEGFGRPKLGGPAMRHVVRTRSWVTLGLFATATVVALFAPAVGMALIFFCLILYIKPEARLSAVGK